MNPSRLTDRVDPATLKVALRTAIFMPASFALTSELLSPLATPFAAFGGFIILAMVTFAGRPLPRLLAWIALVAVGCAFIVIGTYASPHPALAVAVAGILTFLIFFSGIVNQYFAAARNGAVLLLALPLMIDAGPSAVDDRIAGWLLAAAICIPATYLLWRLPWIGELRRRSSDACEALGELIRDPASEPRQAEAKTKVWRLRKRFVATPNRPTGATGVSAAIASLVEELGWLYGLISMPGATIETDREGAAGLRRASADLVEACSAALAGRPTELPTDAVSEALEHLVEKSAAGIRRGREQGRVDEVAGWLEHEFRLRKVSYAALEIAAATAVATGRERAPGTLGDVWSWVAVRGRRQAEAAGRLMAEHTKLESAWLRNAIRGAAAIALAVLVAEALTVQNAFWVVLGTLSILRNNALGTKGSIWRALGGTLAGILIGALVLAAIGDSTPLLWAILPFAVFAAAYAPQAISFGAGQAGFAVLVMVLYNLIEPIGWEVGLIRIQDVALGCGVSLAVGLLIWPRGAAALIRDSLGASFRASARLVEGRALGALAGRTAGDDRAWRDSLAASDRLDAALRQYLDEASGDRADPESLMALASAGLRLRRAAHGLAQIPEQPWFDAPGLGSSPRLEAMIEEVAGWYRRAGEAIRLDQPPPAPLAVDPSLTRELIAGRSEAGGQAGSFESGQARIWVFENLAYLAELSVRYNQRARGLFGDKSPDPAGQAG